jgi:hypothetical protein
MPLVADDAATKNYVDALSQGLIPKESVSVVATSTIVLSGLQTIDDVAVIAGNRVLAAGQGGAVSTPDINNGIWIVAAGAWARAADLANGSSAEGTYCLVLSGTVYGGTGWVCITLAPNDVVGTDPLAFTEFSLAGQIAAGDGLVKTGNTLDVVVDPDGSIAVTPNTVKVGVLATNAQHGVRGGGTQHALAIAGGDAGFMSGADKTKLDGVPAGSGNFVQSVFKELTVDTTTTSATFVTLLSQAITTTGGSLLIWFTNSSSASNNSSTLGYRLTVDGVVKRATGQRVAASNNPQSGALVYKCSGLSAGAHTVVIQWNTTVGTGAIKPVTNPDYDHASLLITEVKT